MSRLALALIVGGILAAVAAFSVSTDETPPQNALVVVAGKSWSVDGKKLSRAQLIKADAKLEASDQAEPQLVLDCGKSGWLSYSCNKMPCTVKPCQGKDANVDVHRRDLKTDNEPAKTDEGSWLSSLLKHEPATLAVLGVRAVGDITESVVSSTAADVSFGPALARVVEGKYCLKLTPLPPGDASQSKTATIDWDRSTDPDGRVSFANVQSGLYTLQIADFQAAGGCTFPSDRTPAWVLIAPDHDFGAINTTWKDYKTQLRGMERDGADPTVLLAVRHAALAHLADGMAEGK